MAIVILQIVWDLLSKIRQIIVVRYLFAVKFSFDLSALQETQDQEHSISDFITRLPACKAMQQIVKIFQ
jgi:hypothetical protein